MLHLRFLNRELRQAGKQASIFTLCVALSIFSMVALNSFKRNVNQSILGDARSLHGGDILLHSHYEFSPTLLRMVGDLQLYRRVQAVRTYDCYSVVRPLAGNQTLLGRLKIVEAGYPLYGRVELQSGRPFDQVLRAGQVLVEQEVLGRLGLQVGDRLQVGSATLTIADVVTHEPDRPVDLFALGPRIFIAAADLERLQLLGKGSRVEYTYLLKAGTDDQAIDAMAVQLAQTAQPGQERVSTYRTTTSGVKVFFDNLFFFLSLISIFTLFLAGIGMQTSLAALLREKEKSLAIIKALGGSTGFLIRHYLALVVFLGLLGSLTGIAAGVLLQRFLPVIFTGLLPAGVTLTFAAGALLEGLTLGLGGVVFFTFLPLYSLRSVKPAAIFRNDTAGASRGILYYPLVAGGFLVLTVLVVRQLQDLQIGLFFMAGTTALVAGITLLTGALLGTCKKIWVPSLALRQASNSLFRPGNATRPIIVTLASALSVLLTIFLVQANLSATYIDSYPPDAPNLFFLDIQPDQKEAFTETVGGAVELYPVIRARLVSINGSPVKEQHNALRRGDSLTREFNLTFRNTLLSDEVIRDGPSLFRQNADGSTPLQVSILDTVAQMGDMQLGDRLEFNIQGVPLQAQVTSIRTRTKSKLYPFFYFVFPEAFLRDAPQTSFAALHVNTEDIAGLENRVVAAFPNISFINMAETAAQLGGLTRKLTVVVNFFAGFSILAGIFILAGSIFATRPARVREVVYYKILGGDSRFVASVLVYEHLLLGLFSSLLAVALAQAGSWGLCRYLFTIRYTAHWPVSLGVILSAVALVIIVGLGSAIGIIRQKPALVLREQNNE